MRRLLFIIVVMLILSVTACSADVAIDQAETTTVQIKDKTKDTVQIEEPATEENDIAPIGITANDIQIAHEIEGFFVEIPDSWLGKVSYDLIDGEMIIYHITDDPGQPTHYPMVVIIGASNKSDLDQLYPSAEVFMELDDIAFYSMSPMDVPYEMESADMDEYEMLLADVPKVLQSVWVLDESESDEILLDEEPEMLSGSPFSISDTTLNDVYLGYSKDAVLNMLGDDFALNDIEIETWDATGEEIEVYKYDSFELTFSEGTLKNADVHTPMLFGPRGFSVGNKLNEVVEAFADSAEYINGDETVFYRGNSSDEERDTMIAPYCILYENDKTILDLACFENENLLDEVTMEELKEFHMYEVHYTCTFFFDENDTVESFHLSYGPLAE